MWQLPYEERKSLALNSSKAIVSYNNQLMMTVGAQQLKQMQLAGTGEIDEEDDGFEDTDLADDTEEFQSRKMSIRAFNINMMSDLKEVKTKKWAAPPMVHHH